MNKNIGAEFFLALLIATIGYLLGFMLLKNCIDPVIVIAEVNEDLPAFFGQYLLYGCFVANAIGFMFIFSKTYNLLCSYQNDDKIYIKQQ